jgi:hypothetical protein
MPRRPGSRKGRPGGPAGRKHNTSRNVALPSRLRQAVATSTSPTGSRARVGRGSESVIGSAMACRCTCVISATTERAISSRVTASRSKRAGARIRLRSASDHPDCYRKFRIAWARRKVCHVGVAVPLGEEGLIVPVIRNADTYSLVGLARAVQDVVERARKRQLKPDEVQGSTFTLTNHGVSGSLFATPIINQPNCAILGVGRVHKRPVVVETLQGDALAIRLMVYLALTIDHRIVDGAQADAFMSKAKTVLEGWA